MDPIRLAILGAGTFLAWAALSNRSPLGEVKAAFGWGDPGAEAITGPRVTFSAYGGPALGTADGGAGYMGAMTFTRWQDIDAYVRARVPEARAGSTYRPGDPGQHGKGKAVDYPGSPGARIPDPVLDRVVAVLAPLAAQGALYELYYRGTNYRAGRPVPSPGRHDDHVHASAP